MINVLVHQIIEICQLRTRLHEQISKVFVRAQQNAADPSGHEIVIIEGDTDDINGNYAQNKETEKKLVKYEIKPKVSQSVLGVLLPSVGKKRRVPSSKGTLKVSVQQAPISESRGKKGVRSNFTTEQRDILKKWLFEHERDPFPNESQKQELCEKASISRQQLKTWFVNNRKRLLDGKQKHC